MNYDYEPGAKNLKQNLNCIHIGANIVFLPKIDSTNNLAKEYAKSNAPEGLVIVADSQTGGRGRMGKSWYSPPKTGVYLSILLKPPLKTDQLSLITLVAGVSAIETINEFSHQSANLKWPNDILINGKKVCGLLCEMIPNKENPCFLVIGIGINANQVAGQFPEDLNKTATSLLCSKPCQNCVDGVWTTLKNKNYKLNKFYYINYSGEVEYYKLSNIPTTCLMI